MLFISYLSPEDRENQLLQEMKQNQFKATPLNKKVSDNFLL
jgi:hypothetical protein